MPNKIVRRPPMGFELPSADPAPALVGEVQEDPENVGARTPVVVAEQKSGFVVKDRRQVK